MADVPRQHRQAALLRRCRNDDIDEPGRLTLAARVVRQGTGNSCGGRIEGKDAVTIEMQHGFQPSRQIIAFPCRTFAPQLGDTVLDFRDRHLPVCQAGSAPGGHRAPTSVPPRHLRVCCQYWDIDRPARSVPEPYAQKTHPHAVTQNTPAHQGPLQVVRFITGT